MTDLNQRFKADAGKAMPDLFEIGLPNAIRLVQGTLEYGAQKYEAHSWRKVPDALERYTRAGARHRQDRQRDWAKELPHHSVLYSRDAESGLPHIAHEIINLMFMLELALTAESELATDCSPREITDNLVGCMKSPPLGHKQGAE